MKKKLIEEFSKYIVDKRILKHIQGGSMGCQWNNPSGGYPNNSPNNTVVWCAAGTSGTCTISMQGSLRCLSCGGGPPGACI